MRSQRTETGMMLADGTRPSRSSAGGARPRRGVGRRSFLLGLALGAPATPLLPACGARGPAAPQAGAPPAKLTFFWRGPGTTPYQYQAAEKEQIFNERFQQYQVEVEYQAGNYREKLTAMFAAGDPPATFWTDHQEILAYLKKGWLEDLTPFAKADRGYRASDYHPVSTDSLTVQGKLYGLSGASFTAGWFYNKALYAKVGAPTPAELMKQGKWTWEAFLDGAKRITAAGGGQVMGIGNGTAGGIRLWLNSNGVQEVDNLKFPTKSNYDAPQAIQAVEFWADTLLRHRVRAPDFGKGTPLGDTGVFMNGQLGMMSRWTTGLSEFVKIQDFNWGMVPVPKGPQGKTPAGEFTFWGFTMGRGLKDERVKRGAWEWLKFYNGKEGQLIEGVKHLLSIPFDKAAMEEWRKRVAATKMEFPELIFELRDKYPNQRVMAPDLADINGFHSKALADVWKGEKGAKEGCTEAARLVNEFLKQNPQKA